MRRILRPLVEHRLTRWSAFRFTTLAFGAVLASGCNEQYAAPVITISPANKTANVGQTVQYTASVQEGSDKTVDERLPSWFSYDQTVATITTPAGVATAKKVGTSKIQVTYGTQDDVGFYVESTMLTVVAAGTPIASVKNGGIVLVLGSTTPIKRAGP
jgi:uncharacterized protein YjdB